MPESLREEYPAAHFTWFAYPYGEHDSRSVEVAVKDSRVPSRLPMESRTTAGNSIA